MRCSNCAFENPPDSRFCFECGAHLSLVCGQCGAELPPSVKFCNRCGKPAAEARSRPSELEPRSYTPRHLAEKILTSRSALEGERKRERGFESELYRLKGELLLSDERGTLVMNSKPLPFIVQHSAIPVA
jgi:ribosomal protein L40E